MSNILSSTCIFTRVKISAIDYIIKSIMNKKTLFLCFFQPLAAAKHYRFQLNNGEGKCVEMTATDERTRTQWIIGETDH